MAAFDCVPAVFPVVPAAYISKHGADETGRVACRIPQGRGWWLTKLHSTVHQWLVKAP